MIFSRRTFYGSAQYYVAMGVFTMLYVIGALIIYVVFITPDLFMAKYLVVVVSLDKIFYVVLTQMYSNKVWYYISMPSFPRLYFCISMYTQCVYISYLPTFLKQKAGQNHRKSGTFGQKAGHS